MKRFIPFLLAAALLLSLVFFAFGAPRDLAGKVAAVFSDTDFSSATESGLQAKSFRYLTEKRAVERIGRLCREDMQKSGILASVSAAQFIVESVFGTNELALKANNCFAMKCSLSGNTWSGSVWDGKSKYITETQEEYTQGTVTIITDEFRKYPCVEDSIADHSAYLLGAMNGDRKRYEGLCGETDYRKAIQIIKDGGYATSFSYADVLCEVIEEYDLTRFDQTVPEAKPARCRIEDPLRIPAAYFPLCA